MTNTEMNQGAIGSEEDTEQLRKQIQQLTDELDAAYQQIGNNTERINDLE